MRTELTIETARPLEILSLGAGVQSSTLLLMSCSGLLPKLDVAIFADTGWEPPAIYENLEWLRQEAAAHGIPVMTVGQGRLRDDALVSRVRGRKVDGQRWASMPLYVLGPSGERGMIRRQCTKEYKIVPIRRFIKTKLLGLTNKARFPKEVVVNHWFGISADEAQRSRTSSDRWAMNVYPLLGIPTDLLPKPYSRRMCLDWLDREYPGRKFPRSACVGCPFHSNAEWREIARDPVLWADATEFDRAIRRCGGLRGEAFLHPSLKPLSGLNLRTDVDNGQGLLWNEECSGHCGV